MINKCSNLVKMLGHQCYSYKHISFINLAFKRNYILLYVLHTQVCSCCAIKCMVWTFHKYKYLWLFPRDEWLTSVICITMHRHISACIMIATLYSNIRIFNLETNLLMLLTFVWAWQASVRSDGRYMALHLALCSSEYARQWFRSIWIIWLASYAKSMSVARYICLPMKLFEVNYNAVSKGYVIKCIVY